MGVASGCGEQEAGVASGSGWNLWVWLLGVVVRRYIDFLILLIPTPLVSVLFYSSIPTFGSFLKCFSFFYNIGWVVGGVIVDFSYWLVSSASCGHWLTGVVRKEMKQIVCHKAL